jgi:hypothetical protein
VVPLALGCDDRGRQTIIANGGKGRPGIRNEAGGSVAILLSDLNSPTNAQTPAQVEALAARFHIEASRRASRQERGVSRVGYMNSKRSSRQPPKSRVSHGFTDSPDESMPVCLEIVPENHPATPDHVERRAGVGQTMFPLVSTVYENQIDRVFVRSKVEAQRIGEQLCHFRGSRRVAVRIPKRTTVEPDRRLGFVEPRGRKIERPDPSVSRKRVGNHLRCSSVKCSDLEDRSTSAPSNQDLKHELFGDSKAPTVTAVSIRESHRSYVELTDKIGQLNDGQSVDFGSRLSLKRKSCSGSRKIAGRSRGGYQGCTNARKFASLHLLSSPITTAGREPRLFAREEGSDDPPVNRRPFEQR